MGWKTVSTVIEKWNGFSVMHVADVDATGKIQRDRGLVMHADGAFVFNVDSVEEAHSEAERWNSYGDKAAEMMRRYYNTHIRNEEFDDGTGHDF